MPANVYHMTIGHATWKNVKTKPLTVFPGHLRNTRALPLEIHLWASSCLLWLLSSLGHRQRHLWESQVSWQAAWPWLSKLLNVMVKSKGKHHKAGPQSCRPSASHLPLKGWHVCLPSHATGRTLFDSAWKKSQKAVKAEQKEETDLNGSTVKRGKVLINAVKLQMNSQAGYVAGWC